MNDKVHLLLIDDEKNYLLVLETLLTEAGYAVTALNDPETALAFLEESEVDIVITDMKMPRISGREVLERIRRAGRDGSGTVRIPPGDYRFPGREGMLLENMRDI